MASSIGRRVWLVPAFVVYAALFLFAFHEADEDVWGRLAVGRLVLTSSEFPYEDVFAYVPTKSPWVDHEWLSGVLFYSVREQLGDRGLVGLRAIVGLAAIAFVVNLASLHARSPICVSAVSMASAVLLAQGFNSVVRAQVFSFALFALYWWSLERGGRWSWLLVPASAVWANLHGGVVTGLLLIAVYALMSPGRRRLLVTVGALSVAMTLVNPYGVDYWRYLVGALSMPRPEIVEWAPVALTPWLDDLHVKLASLLVLLVLACARGHVSWPLRILVVGTLVASWMHVRFMPFLGLSMIVALPRAIESLFETGHAAFPKRWAPSLAPLAAAVLLLSLSLIGTMVSWRNRDIPVRMTVPEDRYPVAAIRRLEASALSGRLAVYFNWGEYALYHLHPRILVSIDGRYETVYADDVVQANWDFTRGAPGGERLLERFPADFALYPRQSGAAAWLGESSRWDPAHRDDVSVLYRNKSTTAKFD